MMKNRKWRLGGAALALLLIAASANDFMAERRRFREEIKNKVETKLDAAGKYSAVIFAGEKGKYNFNVTPADRDRLKAYLKGYFACNDAALLERMVTEMNSGQYVVYKEYQGDGVNLKTVFLSPKAKYWDWLTDTNGIEKMFHVYNFSVGLQAPDADSMFVILQTEGTFYGFTQAVSVPVFFRRNAAERSYNFRMATQAEIVKAVAKMPAPKPGRTKPEEKFLDACRTHLFFQQKTASGAWLIDDAEIMKLYRNNVVNIAEGCPVKESTGHWRLQDDYPYLVVDYSLKTRVNIDALLPSSMRFLSGAVSDAAQTISDEVSVKYLPLSMKNFRDVTQKWTKSGGPN
jgi:hypothetical protein